MQHRIKLTFFRIYKLFFRLFYNLCTMIQKPNENTFVFVLSRSKELEGNLKYVYDELKKQKPKANCIFISTQNKMTLKLFKELPILAKTNFIILDDYYLPIYLIKPKKNVKVVQLWHAAGAFKKFGYSTIGTKFGSDKDYLSVVPIHSNYTHVYVSSKYAKDYFAEAFNMSIDNIYSLGMPRTDEFQDEQRMNEIKENLYKEYPILKDDLINILFAPTYRASGEHQESKFDLVKIIQQISKKLNQNKRIILKIHPYMNKKQIEELATLKNVIIANEYTINDWMLISDAFITDYSSAIFEFALLKKPLVHFVPDYNEYKKNRGFYKNIEEISDGLIVYQEEELIEWLNSLLKGQYFNTERMISLNFDYTYGSSERIVKHLLESEGGL